MSNQLNLFEGLKEKKVKPKKKGKRKGKISVDYGYYSTNGEDFKKFDRFVSVGFDGHNEGTSGPYALDKADE